MRRGDRLSRNDSIDLVGLDLGWPLEGEELKAACHIHLEFLPPLHAPLEPLQKDTTEAQELNQQISIDKGSHGNILHKNSLMLYL